VAAAGAAAPLELLRKESLTGLAPAAAARVLAHSYLAVVPIAPLPYPPLPLSPLCPGAKSSCTCARLKPCSDMPIRLRCLCDFNPPPSRPCTAVWQLLF